MGNKTNNYDKFLKYERPREKKFEYDETYDYAHNQQVSQKQKLIAPDSPTSGTKLSPVIQGRIPVSYKDDPSVLTEEQLVEREVDLRLVRFEKLYQNTTNALNLIQDC